MVGAPSFGSLIGRGERIEMLRRAREEAEADLMGKHPFEDNDMFWLANCDRCGKHLDHPVHGATGG